MIKQELYKALTVYFKAIPTDWESYIISNSQNVFEVNPEITDFSDWIVKDTFKYLNTEPLISAVLKVRQILLSSEG